MDPAERNRRREALMTDAPEKNDSERQPLAEAETIAQRSGAVVDAGTVGEDADLPDDQPRGEIETAAALKAAQASERGVAAGFEDRTESGLLPGEAIGAAKAPAGPYQFMPGDGQAEGQDERNAKFTADQAEAAQAAEDDASGDDADDKPKPKAKKAKKEQD
jgi:hypothetical protein